jgi:hypothetical protein
VAAVRADANDTETTAAGLLASAEELSIRANMLIALLCGYQGGHLEATGDAAVEAGGYDVW